MAALSSEVIDELRDLIARRHDALIRNVIPNLHPADLADLADSVDADARAYLFELLESEMQSRVLVELDERHRSELVEDMAPREIHELVEHLESDDAADVVGELDEPVRDEVLRRMDTTDAAEIRTLLAYDEESAGGLMAAEFLCLPPETTVEASIEAMRDRSEALGDIYAVYVASHDGPLIGVVPLPSLVRARRGATLGALAADPSFRVPPEMDQEEVARLFRQYDAVEAPVVDERARMLGVITVDDVVDVIDKEAEEDLARFAGTDESAASDSVLHATRSRLPWLLVGLAGGVLAALALSRYELSLKEIVSLAFFVPVINAMGGNVAMQSSSIAVRSLALGAGAYRALGRRLLREFLVSLLNGMVLGAIIGGVVMIWMGTFWLALLIGLALFGVILIATTVGALVPVVLDRLKIDPALAAGPFVTTANDVLGIVVYLSLADLLLPQIR